MRDDDIADVLRRSDPARDMGDTRSESQISEDLHAITSTILTARAQRNPRRGWAVFALSGVAVIVAVLGLLIPVWNRAPAITAATPPILELTPTSYTVDEVVDRAIAALDAAPAAKPQRHATFESWSLDTSVGDQRSPHTVITPQIHNVAWGQDLSGTITVTAARSYSSTVGQYASPGAPPRTPKPGTIVSHKSFDSGQMVVLFPGTPPSTAERLQAYLATTTGLNPVAEGAVEYLKAIGSLLKEWTIGPRDQAALLRMLADTDELTVAGEVTDRLGRPGVALMVTSSADPHFEYLLLLGHDTGRIVAVETIYVGGMPEFDVTAPAVTEYTAWR